MFSCGIWSSPQRYCYHQLKCQRTVPRKGSLLRQEQCWAESLDSARLKWGSLASPCSLPALSLIIWDQQNLGLVDLRDKHSDHHPAPLLIRLMALLNLEKKSEPLPKSKPEKGIKPTADTVYRMAKKRRICISQLNEGREHERLMEIGEKRVVKGHSPLATPSHCRPKGSRN